VFEATAHLWHLWFLCAAYKCTYLLTYLLTDKYLFIYTTLPVCRNEAMRSDTDSRNFVHQNQRLQSLCSYIPLIKQIVRGPHASPVWQAEVDFILHWLLPTRKLCCRKDDRVMRPIIWVPWIFGTLWLRPRLLFPTFSWSFVPIDPMNVPTKFEVRSFTRSWDNRGYQKNLAVPGYAHAPLSPKFLMGFYSDWSCKCTRQI